MIEEFKKKGQKAIEHLQHEFAQLHIGRASSQLVENVQVFVQSWGSKQPLNQIASISILDASTLKIEPWDKGILADIEKGIYEAQLGLTPQNMGDHLIVKVPPLTQERRKELTKLISQLGEEAKIAIRNARQEALKEVKKQFEEKLLSEDEKNRLEKQIDETTKEFNHQIEKLVEAKKTQIMEV